MEIIASILNRMCQFFGFRFIKFKTEPMVLYGIIYGLNPFKRYKQHRLLFYKCIVLYKKLDKDYLKRQKRLKDLYSNESELEDDIARTIKALEKL